MEFDCRRKLLDGIEIVVRECSGPTMRLDEGLDKFLIAFAGARRELRQGADVVTLMQAEVPMM